MPSSILYVSILNDVYGLSTEFRRCSRVYCVHSKGVDHETLLVGPGRSEGARLRARPRLAKPCSNIAKTPTLNAGFRRCQKDARQLVSVKPDLAWSRALQAVSLLGRPGDLNSVTDQAARETTYLILAEMAFSSASDEKAFHLNLAGWMSTTHSKSSESSGVLNLSACGPHEVLVPAESSTSNRLPDHLVPNTAHSESRLSLCFPHA